MPTNRTIEFSLIDQAEKLRSAEKPDFAGALLLTRQALGTDKLPLSVADLKELAQDEDQLVLLAAAARLLFDSSKSLMKRSYTTGQLHDRAQETMNEVGKPLYQNDNFRNALVSVNEDIHGSHYNFDREFARDIADFLAVLAVIYPGNKSRRLQDLASSIWDLLIVSVQNESLLDQYFFYLEKSWFLFKSGRKQEINYETLDETFYFYSQLVGNSNPDRLKTVATRVFLMAQAAGIRTTADAAVGVLSKLANFGPNVMRPVENQRNQLSNEKIRNLIFNVLAPFSTPRRDRLNLYADVMSLGNDEQKRLTKAIQ